MKTQNHCLKKFTHVITIQNNLLQQKQASIRRVAIPYFHCSFDSSRSKHDFYRCVHSMTKFCADLQKHVRKVFKNEKKEMLPLTHEEIESGSDMIVMIMRNLMSKSFMVMLQDLIMLIIAMIMTTIAVIKNFKLEGFMVMF